MILRGKICQNDAFDPVRLSTRDTTPYSRCSIDLSIAPAYTAGKISVADNRELIALSSFGNGAYSHADKTATTALMIALLEMVKSPSPRDRFIVSRVRCSSCLRFDALRKSGGIRVLTESVSFFMVSRKSRVES